MSEAADHRSSDLRVGLSASFERELGAADVRAFADLSGDHNPLHLDPEYARNTNYGRCIVHGALQVALASALAGMHLPGRRVVLGAVRSRFPAPLYYPCHVLVHGEIVSWFPAALSGMLRVRVQDKASSALTAEIHMSFSLHEARPQATPGTQLTAPTGARELVVVTGATGALGQRLAQLLAPRFDVLGLARHVPAAADAAPTAAAVCDLESEDWEAQADLALGGRRVYGVVHAAWPGAPKGGLLELELGSLRRQLEFGGPLTVRLARWLVANAAGPGRLVLIGSTAGSLRPELALAGYSLGKATLEHTLRLLSPELAARGITLNAVLPSYMPLGINQAKTERASLLEAAKVPLGRLCAPEDVFGMVEYLLSPAASFVTGQLLPLSGGRL